MYIHATPSDVERWKEIGFEDIFRYLDPDTLELWVENGEKMLQCPYYLEACSLEDRRLMYFCAIHDIKPEKCRDYVCLRVEMGREFLGLGGDRVP
jgi:hypothetical protein